MGLNRSLSYLTSKKHCSGLWSPLLLIRWLLCIALPEVYRIYYEIKNTVFDCRKSTELILPAWFFLVVAGVWQTPPFLCQVRRLSVLHSFSAPARPLSSQICSFFVLRPNSIRTSAPPTSTSLSCVLFFHIVNYARCHLALSLYGFLYCPTAPFPSFFLFALFFVIPFSHTKWLSGTSWRKAHVVIVRSLASKEAISNSAAFPHCPPLSVSRICPNCHTTTHHVLCSLDWFMSPYISFMFMYACPISALYLSLVCPMFVLCLFMSVFIPKVHAFLDENHLFSPQTTFFSNNICTFHLFSLPLHLLLYKYL